MPCAYQSTRPNIAVIASPRIKVVIDGNITPVLPASLWMAEGFGKKIVAAPLKTAPRRSPLPIRKQKSTIKHRRTAARGGAKGGGSLERKPPRSTNAVFWEVPSDLLGDANKHDNAPAFKHCQMRP